MSEQCQEVCTLVGKYAYYDDGRYERILQSWSEGHNNPTQLHYFFITTADRDGPRMLRNVTVDFSCLVSAIIGDSEKLHLSTAVSIVRYRTGQHPDEYLILDSKTVVVPPLSSAQVYSQPTSVHLSYPGRVKLDPGMTILVGYVLQATSGATVRGRVEMAINAEHYIRNC